MPCHMYIFFDKEPSFNALSTAKLKSAKKEFAIVLKGSKISFQSYSLLGLKTGMHFMIHFNTEKPETVQNLLVKLMHTTLGKHLRITYTLLGMSGPTQYNPHGAPKESVFDKPHTYFVVYPFTKTIEWHLLPFDERRSIMKAHVDVGRKYSKTISQLLAYSFGIDDHEFIVSYQMDSLDDFQKLVMEMRTTESRRYTKNDLPIFTCIHMPISEALAML